MHTILLYLAAGILAGRFLFPKKGKHALLRCGRYLQAMGVSLSLFVMGITLGQSLQNRESLLSQGVTALGFAASAAAGSGVLVWLLGRWAGWLSSEKRSKLPFFVSSPREEIPEQVTQVRIDETALPKETKREKNEENGRRDETG